MEHASASLAALAAAAGGNPAPSSPQEGLGGTGQALSAAAKRRARRERAKARAATGEEDAADINTTGAHRGGFIGKDGGVHGPPTAHELSAATPAGEGGGDWAAGAGEQ